ncbi:MAG: HlyD family efflux transporter periplasmic adaptor subunit, partial [Verrucomicrobiae bacterium]|nr:HlyD family efflux transporter periplasmic adaptor subunit [Verrucomicrobiae bacterium]
GWGCVLFRVEDSLALSSGTDSPPSSPLALIQEATAPAASLKERYHQAAGELLTLACENVARSAIEGGDPILMESELAGQRCLVMALPVFDGAQLIACLCRVHGPNQRGEATAMAGLQTAGLLRLLAEARTESRTIRSRFGKVAAFVELLANAEGGTDFAECGRRLANHLREVLECDTVALAVRGFGGTKLAGISGESGPAETHSPGRRALLSHLAEAMHRRQPLTTRRSATGSAPEGDAAVSLREWFDPGLSLCFPLIDAEGQLRGGWIFLWKEEPADLSEKQALIKAAGTEVAPLLALLHRSKPGPVVGSILRLWKRGTASQRRFATAVAAIVLAATLVPLPYPVRSTCELQPVTRRVIAAPFDGILQRSLVRAGDLVTEGQLLAELDGREIRSQLAETISRRERAQKESDLALAEDRVADARVAAFEAEGLQHEIELLEYRQQHLQVRSPISGIVLEGDLDRSEGAPVRIGDALFEVGPLDRLVAEIAVDATDISLVETGAPVSVKLEATSQSTVKSTLLRVSPKSEWVDDQNAFICEAEIDNPDGSLRAGLKGKAKIDGPRRPLVWIWARDAWLALRYHLW